MFSAIRGKKTLDSAVSCFSCGAKLSQEQQTRKTPLSIAAGIIILVDGGITFGWVAFWALGLATILSGNESRNDWPIALALTIISAALAILKIAGGISALQRRRWALALSGAIAAILPLFPLGITSVILLGSAKSKGEFEQPQASEGEVRCCSSCGADLALTGSSATGVPPAKTKSATPFVIASAICAAVSLFLLPPFFGVAGIVLGYFAFRQNRTPGVICMAVSGACMVVGGILGAWTSS